MKHSLTLSSAFLFAAVCGCTIAPPTAPEPEYGDAADSLNAQADAVPSNALGRTKHFHAPQGRKMAFTAQLVLCVEDVRTAIGQVRTLTLERGGYVRRMDDRSLSLAVPVEKAESTLQEISRFGVVLSLQTQGEDVTRQVTDTAVRLENLQRSRKRLLALLEKAGKVDEMVQVEREITRVTTELERLEAQQKDLRNRVQFVTMTVMFKAAAQQPVPKTDSPIGWINTLGADILKLNVSAALEDDSALLFDLTLPAGFIQSGEGMAVSADNCIIVLQEQPNAITAVHWYGNDYAPLAFYRPMIEKALKNRFRTGVEVKERTVGGEPALIFTVLPVIGKVQYTYRAVVAVKKDSVKLLEVRARSEVFQKTLPDAVWENLLDSVRF